MKGQPSVNPRRGADRRGVVGQDGAGGCGGQNLGAESGLAPGWPPAAAVVWGSGAG